jgi:hypothetical protein
MFISASEILSLYIQTLVLMFYRSCSFALSVVDVTSFRHSGGVRTFRHLAVIVSKFNVQVVIPNNRTFVLGTCVSKKPIFVTGVTKLAFGFAWPHEVIGIV